MIGYCPIDFDEPIEDFQPSRKTGSLWRINLRKAKATPQPKNVTVDEDTECKLCCHVFFIVGVIALAAMDSVKKVKYIFLLVFSIPKNAQKMFTIRV
jgi:hypothetical protein